MSLVVFRNTDKSFDDHGRDGFIEFHKIHKEGGKFITGPGIPLSKSALESLKRIIHAGIVIETQPELFNPNILYADFAYGIPRVVWYLSKRKRMLYFKKDLKIQDGQVMVPPTIFSYYNGTLSVWCYAKPGRPKVDTPLLVSPYMNTNEEGRICLGQNKIKQSVSVNELIDRCEYVFFRSPFTHSMGSRYKNLDAQWRKWMKAKSVNVDYLKPSSLTMRKILKDVEAY